LPIHGCGLYLGPADISWREPMPILPGRRLGPYEILSAIGAGGMGEVYQAHDTKLGRDVAIKVLPANFVNDPERLSRFQREARMLAALNHANIATIYGLEQCDGVTCLVMELVSGETLAERVKAGPPGIEEALKIAVQIAEALEAAHEKSIIHRDLKPANVKLTPEGKVKVLDFGLAKAFAGDTANDDPSNSPTLSAAATMQGVILGTAAYMSPEQARGKACDKRTDIWAFGCVLYALLTGRQAFQGESTTEILAAVLRGEPDWQALPSSTPRKIRDLLGRCLQKDLRRRLHDSADARIEIEEVMAAPAKVEPAAAAKGIRTLSRRELIIGVGALPLVAVITGLAVWNLKPPPQRPVTRFAMSLPPGQRLDTARSAIAISPDGTRLVYSVGPSNLTAQLYIRAMEGLEAHAIPGTEGGGNPFFSPDGQWIGFTTAGNLMKVSLSGGAPVNLTGTSAAYFGASWGDQGEIALAYQAGGAGIQKIPDTGGTPQPLTRLEKGEASHRWPEFLPRGEGVLFMALQVANSGGIAAQSLGASEHRGLLQTGIRPRYTPSGHLVYSQGANLMAAPFDSQRLAITGAAVPVIEGVLAAGEIAQYSFSSTGTLAYVPGSIQAARANLVWVDRKGAQQPVAAPPHNYVLPRVSPDGKRVAAGIEETDSQIWVYDIGRDTLTRLTFERGANIDPVWTPDGKRIVFKGAGNRLFSEPADGSGSAEPLTSSELAVNNVPGSWSPDGQVLTFMEINPNTGYDVYTLSLKDGKPQPFVRTASLETAPRFSPDGHFIAYASDESGRVEIYVRPYPGPGGKWQISTEGGSEPVWNPKGGELFYRNGNKMMAVEGMTQPTFSVGKPKMLFEGPYLPTPRSFPNYDVSADGQRFLMLKANEQAQAAPTQINVVLNWFEELKQKVPTGKK
jgi:Tol biopolymer transport system component